MDSTSDKRLKIAIAHDYLTQRGGAERVVLSMYRAFPEARIYTTLYSPEDTFPDFRGAEIVVSPLNRVSHFRKDHRTALPFLAPVASGMKIDADIVLTSSSGWAHGFKTSGTQVVYCHTPARWLYLTDDYLGNKGGLSVKQIALGLLTPALKRWDQKAARRAKNYIANSTVVQDRIRRVYGVEAPIVFPPHSLDISGDRESFPELDELSTEPYLLVVARLMKYKNVDQVMLAARQLDLPLLVVGDGPEKAELQRLEGERIRIVSGLSDGQLRAAYAGAGALIAASYEDFGITPLEAAAWGLPTLALRGGGYLDTVIEGKTGLFFESARADLIAKTVQRARDMEWNAELIQNHADKFSEARFHREIKEQIEKFTGFAAAT
ncbi:glycosyltransferase involved in cell wall biosynthesis [Neomicrococcus aestuarii]|uniref:D-inositol 3-phosphate glycosyltransferase n=1 Tax=Neomicrococcus aestuarii TaxID=556325 RepID=A0A7W8TRI9_9MICC|nr:glycosyltransferase [Neomicrococcus aestuarii]MBB5511448.1 glycosyltransferase involved in cell wall biosynthesis [Neomicrococcus aestuarii]